MRNGAEHRTADAFGLGLDESTLLFLRKQGAVEGERHLASHRKQNRKALGKPGSFRVLGPWPQRKNTDASTTRKQR